MHFFESEDTEVLKADRNKLFASNEEQIDNHTLLLDMYKYLWCGCCSLLIFVAKKAYTMSLTLYTLTSVCIFSILSSMHF